MTDLWEGLSAQVRFRGSEEDARRLTRRAEEHEARRADQSRPDQGPPLP